MTIPYRGTRWFKCDLHLHTTASKCFQDKAVTPEQWVDRAIEQGLNCVAMTDHNTGFSIDAIKVAAKSKNLTVFPGVEITCDSSKIHLLILFDTSKTTQDIEHFLVRADIKSIHFGEELASTFQSVLQIASLAKTDGALVIPAHIDEYSGLCGLSDDNLKKFYALENINAVQVVHKEFLDKNLKTSGNSELKL
jgi:predicted metal-dependent phosphoesterase TrpH